MQVPGGEWQGRTGEAWAAEWRRTDRSFGNLTERLLQRTRDYAFTEVLDIGCGAGELSLAIARGRPECHVTGVDISAALVAAARGRGEHLGNAEFLVDDASLWRPSGNRPDLLISRHGVMFFADPVAAFANLAAGAADDATLLFSCFREPGLNPFMTDVARLLPPGDGPADPHAPGPFAFADRVRVAGILEKAGWTDILFEKFDFAMVVGAGDDAVGEAMSYFDAIGPAARARADLPAPVYEEFLVRLHSLVETRLTGSIVAMGAAAWIVSGRKD